MGKDKAFIFKYLAVTALLAVAASFLVRTAWPQHYPYAMWTVPAFFAVVPALLPLARRIARGKDSAIFFMAYRGMKLLAAIVLLLVYFSSRRADALCFAAVFASFYIVLIILETAHFIKKEKES